MGSINDYASTSCPLFGKRGPLDLAPVSRFDMFAEAHIGTSASPMLYTEGEPVFHLFATCANTSTTSAEPFRVESVMTGAGGCGGRAMFSMYTDVALGGWANALKAYTEFGTSGRVTGLGSAICAEIVLEESCTQGHYAALEAEIIAESGAKLGGGTSFLYVNGTDGSGLLNDEGCLFEIGAVFTSDAAHMWYDHQGSVPSDIEEWVKVRTPAGIRWLALFNAVV